MKKILTILIIALSLIGVSMADNLVKYQSPIAKDLSNLNLSEIRAIFAGDDAWFGDGATIGTASQRGILKDTGEGALPEGYMGRKAAFLGDPTLENDPRVMT